MSCLTRVIITGVQSAVVSASSVHGAPWKDSAVHRTVLYVSSIKWK